MIRTPYLLFLGDAPDQLAAKVAQGVADWRPLLQQADLEQPMQDDTRPEEAP